MKKIIFVFALLGQIMTVFAIEESDRSKMVSKQDVHTLYAHSYLGGWVQDVNSREARENDSLTDEQLEQLHRENLRQRNIREQYGCSVECEDDQQPGDNNEQGDVQEELEHGEEEQQNYLARLQLFLMQIVARLIGR
jgi:hypothetical protein